MAHTLGPWEWYFDSGAGRWSLIHRTDPYDGDIVKLGGPPSMKLSDDMLLVATAPVLLEALEAMLFSAVSAEHGMEIAEALADNNWSWPDNAPRFVNPTHEQARAAIAQARKP